MSSNASEATPARLSTDELSAQLGRDALAFLRHYAWPIVIAAMAGLLAHGVALTNASLSADEGMLVVQPGLSGLSSGRPVMTLVKVVTRDLMPLPLWNTALALTLVLIAGVVFAFLLTRAAARTERHRPAVTLFLVIFVTLPTTAFLLMWGEISLAFSLGLVIAAVSALFAWLFVAEGWGRTAALAAAFMAFFAVTTYQAQVFVALAGVLASNIAFCLRPARPVPRLRDEAWFSLRLLSPILAGGAVGGLLTLSLIQRGQGGSGYHAGLVGWGTDEPLTIIGDVLRQVADYATGEGFFGGWVLIPTLVIAAALMLQLVVNAVRGASWWPVLLLAALLLSPFGASLVLGNALPQRAMHVLPLAAGAAWLLWAYAFPRTTLRTVVLVGATILLTVWHSNVTSHLYFIELTTFQTDRLIASSIVDRLADQGWDGSEVPFVSVGTRPSTVVEDIQGGDAFGFPFFNELQGGIRATAFMQAMGHPVAFASLEQRAAAAEIAASMPDWPAAGAVVLQDGMAIVRFSDPS